MNFDALVQSPHKNTRKNRSTPYRTDLLVLGVAGYLTMSLAGCGLSNYGTFLSSTTTDTEIQSQYDIGGFQSFKQMFDLCEKILKTTMGLLAKIFGSDRLLPTTVLKISSIRPESPCNNTNANRI